MNWSSIVGIVVAAQAMAGAAHAERVFYLHDPGGNVAAHIYTYKQVNAEYDRVVIDGRCKSACTVVLGTVPLDKICIAPGGYFMFHAAHYRDRRLHFADTQLMMQSYAPEVREWVTSHHALDQVDPYTYLYPRDVRFIRHCRK